MLLRLGKKDNNQRAWASWFMTGKCNFSCNYCRILPKPGEVLLSAQVVIAALKATGKDWTIALDGGEPFLYPRFVQLCRQLSSYYRLSINTNLSMKAEVADFAKYVDPAKVEWIYASVHIIQREQRNIVQEFIDSILLLQSRKFKIITGYLLYPDLIDRFRADYLFFQASGIRLLPKVFRGTYQGRRYPQAYSEHEKRLILSYNPWALHLSPIFPQGQNCSAGVNFIRIHPEGRVTRCMVDQTVLGHVHTGINLQQTAQPCKAKICPCHGYTLIKKGYYSYETLWADQGQESQESATSEKKLKELFTLNTAA